MKKILWAGIVFLNAATAYSTEIGAQPTTTIANYPLFFEIINDDYSDFWSNGQYLQYGPNDKVSVPAMGQSITITTNWGGVLLKDDFDTYFKSGWRDIDGNHWMQSGSLHIWNDYGDFRKNGKNGQCLFEPGLNFNVKTEDGVGDKVFTKEYNKVIIHLKDGFPNPKVLLEFSMT